MVPKLKPFMNIGPGFFIKEELDERGWTQEDLAEILGVSSKHLSQIINNKQPITIDTAKLLHKVFGQSPLYWLNLYTNYRLRLEETTEAEADVEIKATVFNRMPIAEMVRKNWINPWNKNLSQLLKIVRRFWDINNNDLSFMDKLLNPVNMPAFRKSTAFSERFNPYYALTWYQMAKKCAKVYKASVYNRTKLQALANQIGECSYYEDGIEDFINKLNICGVKFFVLSHLEHTYVDGASFWDGNNPVVVWTARYKREDNFWWTIAHEISHIILHLRSKEASFIDSEQADGGQKEDEANAFAASAIKRDEILTEIGRGQVTHAKVDKCADRLKISPAVIVGQLHHLEVLPQKYLRRMLLNATDYIPKKCYAEQ